MKSFIFFALIVSAALATPTNIRESEKYDKDDPLPCPGNQDINEYFGEENTPAKSNTIKWVNIKSKEDWEAVKKDIPKCMMVIDVTDNGNNNIISKEFTMNEFLNDVAKELQIKPDKKYGVKYNIKTLEAFENLKSNFEEIRSFTIPAFPQMFHIDAIYDKSADYTLLEETAEFYSKPENKDLYNCYTFSFGWDRKGCTETVPTSELITKVNSLFTTDLKKNLDSDVNDVPTTQDFTVTYKLNRNSFCFEPKTLQAKVDKVKQKEDVYLDFPIELETHAKLCKLNKGILKDLIKPSDAKDLTEIKWKLVEKLDDLKETVDEDIVQINYDGGKFLDDKEFHEVLAKFMEKQLSKGLLLNLKSSEAVEAYWNIKIDDLNTIKGIHFGIQIESDFVHDDNKWIDCYTAAISPKSSGDGSYTEEDLNKLKTYESAEKIYALAFEKVAETNVEDIIELLSDVGNDKYRALKLNMPAGVENDGIKLSRNILRKIAGYTFLMGELDAINKIHMPVKASDFFDIANDKRSLNFADGDCGKTITAENAMVQVTISDVSKINDCLDKFSDSDKNGLKMELSQLPNKAALEKAIKYRNYPIWIQLNVDTNINFGQLTASDWYHLVIGSSEELDLDKLKEKLNDLKNKVDELTLAIRANDYTSNAKEVNDILKDTKKDLLILMKKDDEVSTRQLREKLDKTKPYFEYPHKFVLDECPVNDNDILKYFKDVNGLEDNLSILTFSDILKNNEEIVKAVESKKNMLNFEIKLDKGKLVSGEIALEDLLTLEKQSSALKFGLKLTFTKEDAFKAVFDDAYILESLRTMKRPIWINVNAVEKDKTFDFGYKTNNDLIDCRTLSLGFGEGGADKYSKKNVETMKNLPETSSPNKKVYVIELIHIGTVWETVKPLTEGGNYITLLSTEGEAGSVDYGSMEKILEDNKNIFFFDFPDVVRKDLHGGCASVSASLFLASLLACFALIF